MKIYLRSHYAYTPLGATDKPPCSFLPTLLRRRCSLTTRMALEASHHALQSCDLDPKNVFIIHTSRYGEIQALHELLQNLVLRTPLSPTTFSNSVHHTPIGYFSLYSHNQGIGRTLSAGPTTFAMGLLEAYTLCCQSSTPILLVHSDEFVPLEFNIPAPPHTPVGAWAFVFSTSSENAKCHLRFDATQPANCSTLTAPDCLDWLESTSSTLSIGVGGGSLIWNR